MLIQAEVVEQLWEAAVVADQPRVHQPAVVADQTQEQDLIHRPTTAAEAVVVPELPEVTLLTVEKVQQEALQLLAIHILHGELQVPDTELHLLKQQNYTQ